MGTTALGIKRRARRVSRVRSAGSTGLSFNSTHGPVLAICGFVGGAGTSTLAYLLAHQAARESESPVLLAEAEAASTGLAVLAGRASRVGLLELANRVAEDRAPDTSPFVSISRRLRLLATAPQVPMYPTTDALRALIEDARAAHGLVVLDCRTIGDPHADALLRLATHVVWTLPANLAAIRHARTLLAARTLPPRGAAREAFVSLALAQSSSAKVRCLRQLADARGADRIVLVPHVAALPRAAAIGQNEVVATALCQVAGFLRS